MGQRRHPPTLHPFRHLLVLETQVDEGNSAGAGQDLVFLEVTAPLRARD
jgi:hypothetical protein